MRDDNILEAVVDCLSEEVAGRSCGYAIDVSMVSTETAYLSVVGGAGMVGFNLWVDGLSNLTVAYDVLVYNEHDRYVFKLSDPGVFGAVIDVVLRYV